VERVDEPSLWCNEQLPQRFAALTELLQAGEIFWRQHAFQTLQLPWEVHFAQLSRDLRALTPAEVERLSRCERELQAFLAARVPLFAVLGDICRVGRFAVPPLPDIEPRDIPGRKWQQLRHFAPCVPDNGLPLLEWCAGKAHLGRVLARERNVALAAVEYDEQLIRAGAKLAARERVTIDFHCADVLRAQTTELVRAQQNAVALHACGDLHAQLLRACAQRAAATVTLAPCCYQLMRDDSRYVLSRAAAASGLQLRRDDLRTAVHGTVTAAAGEVRRRRQLQAWRLGFDLLRRELLGDSGYLPTPSLPASVIAHGFEAFCRTLAAAKQLELPVRIDFARYERAGDERLHEVAALDLPRIAFRRVLELWLVVDRALFLAENGYAVEVGEFCEPQLTPRNLAIRARRHSPAPSFE